MHDFRATEADEMYFPELARRMRFFKETEKGVSEMCEAMEKLIKEENDKVKIDTREQDIIYAVKNVSRSFNVSEEEAAEKLGYGVAAYEAAKKNQNVLL